MAAIKNVIYKELKPHEMVEFMKLISYRHLLETDIEDWRKSPNEFVALHIPESIKYYIKHVVKDKSNLGKSMDLLIRDLLLRGIVSIAKEYGDVDDIDDLIEDILTEGITIQ